METIASLTSRHAHSGVLEWIGVRPERHSDLVALGEAKLLETGIEGDHYNSGGKRSVTLVQHEHLEVIAAFLNRPAIHPSSLRRNLVVRGINLLGLRNRDFYIGHAVLRGTGLCAPCSRMEETFGTGGYTAVRGHGGITAQIIKPGNIFVGDQISVL